MIKINEIFYSIQGESTLVGLPTVFIRTSGCHLRCHYCDTTYAYTEGHSMSLESILKKVASFLPKYVCVTGGEPLLQKEVLQLFSLLCDKGYTVSLETSGDLDCFDVDPRVRKIIDIKTPDSGEGKAFKIDNLKSEPKNTEFKFVICSKADLIWADEFVVKHNLNKEFVILYSPSFGAISEKWLAEQIIERKSPARLQLQLHKYIWGSDQRGV